MEIKIAVLLLLVLAANTEILAEHWSSKPVAGDGTEDKTEDKSEDSPKDQTKKDDTTPVTLPATVTDTRPATRPVTLPEILPVNPDTRPISRPVTLPETLPANTSSNLENLPPTTPATLIAGPAASPAAGPVAATPRLITIDPTLYNIIDGVYGTCCRVHYIFSLDASGSMNNHVSLSSLMSSWKNWLVSQRASSQDYWVSAHTFNTKSDNLIVHKAPMHWNPVAPTTGGTDWGLALQFLADRLNIGGNICYTMLTDESASNIWINNNVASSFRNAYQQYKSKGCYFYLRIIDVSKIPQFVAVQPLAAGAQEQQATRYPVRLTNIFSGLGINAEYYQPTSRDQVSNYYKCARNL